MYLKTRQRDLDPAPCTLCIGLVLALVGCNTQHQPSSMTMGDNARPSLIRIGVLSDMHLWITDNPRYAVYTEHFDRAINEAIQADLDLILIPGDLTNSGKDEEYERYRRMIGRIEVPVLCVPGNHDTGNKVSSGKKRLVSSERVRQYQEHVGDSYYSVYPLPGLRVIGIDTSLLGSGLVEEEMQWSFLSNAAAPALLDAATILMLHYPVYKDHPDEEDGYGNIDRQPRARILDLLQQGGVDLVLSGHLHQPNDLTTLSGVRMITAPALSFGLPMGEQPQAWAIIEFNLETGEVESVQQRQISEPTQPRSSLHGGLIDSHVLSLITSGPS